ncbi:hypothetical protein Pst134EA_028134 [Puccinia striiformis f. sp. tritici]|uniref:hypothetical protein n=1 Tax=Puccinia striiformis f. sp. tritici TaxID=168172 RepID=UPI002008D7C3|nr:hypothetical protein Pst134EA_028134 [Puccinia striiformis f. sp. tritici]KAH9448839.1 hypothetical protein Pst134EA_028134 [Puccinia striiformis f. sp. tritici]
MDDDMESVLTDLSSELATNKDYPSTSELSEPPELNPISNEDDTNSLTSEDEDHDSDSMDLSEEDLPLSSHIWTKKRSYGHVHTFDKALTEDQQSLIIADIHFTGLLKLEDDKRNDLNFILAFLQECKKFVNVVGSEVQSCSGSMWAIGWQKSMTKLEIVEQYVNTETIKKNQEAFDQHVQDSDKVSKILWKLFHKIGNVALLANQQFMVGHNLPAFSDSQIPGRNSGSSKDFFSTNLTFTSHGFSNHPHKDTSDEPKIPFAFLLVIPTRKSTGQVALEIKGYNGQMVL